MTTINKPIRRESEARIFDTGSNRPIIVSLYPKRIGLRIKGSRTEYSLPITTALTMAVCAEIDAKRPTRKSTKRVSELG